VLANRLSQNPAAKVLLLERGTITDSLITRLKSVLISFEEDGNLNQMESWISHYHVEYTGRLRIQAAKTSEPSRLRLHPGCPNLLALLPAGMRGHSKIEFTQRQKYGPMTKNFIVPKELGFHCPTPLFRENWLELLTPPRTTVRKRHHHGRPHLSFHE
jgi:hypothetical protein